MTTEVTLAHILTGLIGGLIRALVGITKSSTFTPENSSLNGNTLGFLSWYQRLLELCPVSLPMATGVYHYLPDTRAQTFWRGCTG